MNRNTITHASVFSGIGGPEVAAVMLGWENLFHCEINPFGKAVLDYWFPNSKSYEDITTTDFSEWRGRVNVLTGGFPCQPFSYAGQRRGAQDDRYLWPYMFRCIDQVQPDWVVAENVAGILTMVEQGEVSEVASSADLFDSLNDIRRYRLRETFTLQRICDDLESHGYSVQPVLIPACAVGAPHRRDRVFIIGHRNATDTCSCGQSASEQQGERAWQAVQQQAREQSFDGTCGQGASSAPADTVGSGAGTPGASGSTQSHWSDTNQQQSQRRATHKWSDRFYAILRHATDAYCEGREERMRSGQQTHREEEGAGMDNRTERPCNNGNATYTESKQSNGHGLVGESGKQEKGQYRRDSSEDCGLGARWQGFPTVSPVHRGNDGLPFRMDDLTLPFGKWRTESIKAYGNAIVPQVMYEIFRAIEQIEHNK